MKKILPALLALVMLLSSSACASQTDTPSSTSQEPFSAAESAESSATAPAGNTPEPVTLKLWWPGSGEGYEQLATGMKELVEAKYDHITVDTLVVPWSDHDSKMNVAFAGGTAPDIFGVGMNPLPNYVQTGQLQELDDLLGSDWDGWEDIQPNVLENATYEGKFYGVMMCDIRPLMWRKDLFEKAGLDPEKPPTNKEELWDYAVKLTEYDESGKVTMAGFEIQTSGYLDQTLFASMLMHGQDHFWDEDYNLALLEPKTIEAIEYCKRFVDEDLCDFATGIGTSTFADGLAAMTMSTSCNTLGNLKQIIGFDKIGVTIPCTDEKGTNFLGGTIVSVYNKSKYLDDAILAFREMTGTEGCILAGTTAGFCPPRKSALDAYIAQDPAIFQACADSLPVAKTYGPLNPYFADFRNIAILPWMEQVYYSKIDIQTGLQNATDDYIQAQKDRDANA